MTPSQLQNNTKQTLSLFKECRTRPLKGINLNSRYGELKTKLGMTDEDFMKYLKAKVVREQDDRNLVVNLNKLEK